MCISAPVTLTAFWIINKGADNMKTHIELVEQNPKSRSYHLDLTHLISWQLALCILCNIDV